MQQKRGAIHRNRRSPTARIPNYSTGSEFALDYLSFPIGFDGVRPEERLLKVRPDFLLRFIVDAGRRCDERIDRFDMVAPRKARPASRVQPAQFPRNSISFFNKVIVLHVAGGNRRRVISELFIDRAQYFFEAAPDRLPYWLD